MSPYRKNSKTSKFWIYCPKRDSITTPKTEFFRFTTSGFAGRTNCWFDDNNNEAGWLTSLKLNRVYKKALVDRAKANRAARRMSEISARKMTAS